MKKINSCSDYFSCIILSFALVAAPSYVISGNCHFGISFVIDTIWVFLTLIFVNYWTRKGIIFIVKNNQKKDFLKRWNCILSSRFSLIYITLIILLCWIPIIISLYPGTLINDTWGQLEEFIRYFNIGGTYNGVLSDHHPIIDTLIMGTIIVPFGEKLNNWQLGFYVYTLLQVFFTATSFALTIDYAFKKFKLDSKILLVFTLVYALCPLFPISAQTISKDALFSWIYVLFTILFIEALRTDGSAFYKWKYILSLIVVSFFCICTKKVGLYIIILSLTFLVIFIRKAKLHSFITLIFILFLSVGTTGIIKHSLNVQPGGKQEMLSLPFQQTARYVKFYKDDITSKEYQSINKLIKIKKIGKVYNPTVADPVKGYKDRGTTKECIAYLRAWLSMGIKHPKVYISAFNAMVSGWFSFNKYVPLMDMSWHSQLDGNLINERSALRSGIINKLSLVLEQSINNLYQVPPFNIFLSYAFYASILPTFVLSTFIRKWNNKSLRKYWLVGVPLFLSLILGCWLSPLSTSLESMRYLYPVVYTLPVLVLLVIYMYKKEYYSESV